MKKFKDLNLGILYDFTLRLPHADKRWVTLWIEKFTDGQKESQSLLTLGYGLNPNQTPEGNIGFGILKQTELHSFFLYGSGAKSVIQPTENILSKEGASTWGYAIGNEKVEIQIGKELVLAAYRQTSEDFMQTYDLQDEDSMKQMINDDDMVLLLKIKIEEGHPSR